MKYLVKMTALALSAALLCGCSAFLEEAGVPKEYSDKIDAAYEDAADMFSEGADKLSDNMNIMTDRLAELAIGSDQAYKMIAGAYAKTRLSSHYTTLEEKTAEGEGLCRFTGLFGKANSWYTAEKNPYPQGQSDWYVYGRFGEDNNIQLGDFSGGADWLSQTEAWVKTVYAEKKPEEDLQLYGAVDGFLAAGLFVSRDAGKVYPHSIAVCAQEMFYVEDVQYEEGSPVTVWCSQADGALQQIDYAEFMQQTDIQGYIIPLNIFI